MRQGFVKNKGPQGPPSYEMAPQRWPPKLIKLLKNQRNMLINSPGTLSVTPFWKCHHLCINMGIQYMSQGMSCVTSHITCHTSHVTNVTNHQKIVMDPMCDTILEMSPHQHQHGNAIRVIGFDMCYITHHMSHITCDKCHYQDFKMFNM